MTDWNQVLKILDKGSKEEKIQTLESLSQTENPNLIRRIISKLDDPDIEVRGESFSALVLNKNKISQYLIQSLDSESKNIRGFSVLILANRKDMEAISHIIKLTNDQSSMVKACALGALGYLRAGEASDVIRRCFFDSNLEVKKSAVKAAIDIGDKLTSEDIEKISKDKDEELERLILMASQKRS